MQKNISHDLSQWLLWYNHSVLHIFIFQFWSPMKHKCCLRETTVIWPCLKPIRYFLSKFICVCSLYRLMYAFPSFLFHVPQSLVRWYFCEEAFCIFSDVWVRAREVDNFFQSRDQLPRPKATQKWMNDPHEVTSTEANSSSNLM